MKDVSSVKDFDYLWKELFIKLFEVFVLSNNNMFEF